MNDIFGVALSKKRNRAIIRTRLTRKLAAISPSLLKSRRLSRMGPPITPGDVAPPWITRPISMKNPAINHAVAIGLSPIRSRSWSGVSLSIILTPSQANNPDIKTKTPIFKSHSIKVK